MSLIWKLVCANEVNSRLIEAIRAALGADNPVDLIHILSPHMLPDGDPARGAQAHPREHRRGWSRSVRERRRSCDAAAR
ncbi:hypothetical protein [Rhodovulum sp. ES.010]|uniref:hypothetical protein n=1 Tax=Rhodovulum sp. ES.010 TaxID=1882821 RepID=UPI0015881D22|nr:hypothetical protein [Rhodovulum sp. ES.010]